MLEHGGDGIQISKPLRGWAEGGNLLASLFKILQGLGALESKTSISFPRFFLDPKFFCSLCLQGTSLLSFTP